MGSKGALKEWKRCKTMNTPYWTLGSGNEGLGFVARGKVAICGFMFGREQSDKDFLLKVQWAIDADDLGDIVEF